MATPKAVLAELIVVALLAPVPEPHHALTPAIGTLHRMEDLVKTWRETEKMKSNKQTLRKLQSLSFTKASKKNQTNHKPGSQSLKEIITPATPWLLSPEEIILDE